MTPIERYIFLMEYWQSKMIEYNSLREMAEKQFNFYQEKRIREEQN